MNNLVWCCYNKVQYDTILHTKFWWMKQNINQELKLNQRHAINSPSRASYGVSIMRIWEKIDRIITTLLSDKYGISLLSSKCDCAVL